MATEAVVYANAEALVETLNKFRTELRKYALSPRYGLDMEETIQDSVSGNTLRGFQRKKLGMRTEPSALFRQWANDFVMWSGYYEFLEITTQADYDAFFERARTSLLHRFENDGAVGQLVYGQTAKLIDLMFKAIVRFHEVKQPQRELLSGFLHMPLEKNPILGVQNCGVVDSEGNPIKIPKSPTAAYIKTEEMYNAFQNVFAKVATAANLERICIDYLVWDKDT